MFFQPHGLCFHILENKPHPVLNTHHNSFTHSRASPSASPIPNSKPHKAPTRTHNPSPALFNAHNLRFVPHWCLSPSLSPSSRRPSLIPKASLIPKDPRGPLLQATICPRNSRGWGCCSSVLQGIGRADTRVLQDPTDWALSKHSCKHRCVALRRLSGSGCQTTGSEAGQGCAGPWTCDMTTPGRWTWAQMAEAPHMVTETRHPNTGAQTGSTDPCGDPWCERQPSPGALPTPSTLVPGRGLSRPPNRKQD